MAATIAAVPSPASEGAPPAPAADASGRAEQARDGYTDTSVFMRELSSLSDDPEQPEPVVTRLVVPLTEHRRKRRFWNR